MAKRRGWFGESKRHALASKGVKTGMKSAQRSRHPFIHGHPERQPEHIEEEMAEITSIEKELGHEADYEEDKSVPFGAYPKNEDYIIMPEEGYIAESLTGNEWVVVRGSHEGGIMGPFEDFHKLKSAIAKQMEKENQVARVWYMEHGLGAIPIKFRIMVRARK